MTTTTTAATTPAPAYGPDTDIAAAENASPAAAGQAAPYATRPSTTTKETIPMTDKTIPADVTPEDMAHARSYVQDFLDAMYAPDRTLAVARVLHALLPTPPTLADMTEEERAACQWMQCDVNGFQGQLALATPYDDDGDAGLISDCGEVVWSSPGHVTPRPDLPRMTWPGDKKPAPALPEGWRLADHEKYGRVVVTNTTPDIDGNVSIVAPAPGAIGNDWHVCRLVELTYIDQGADQ